VISLYIASVWPTGILGLVAFASLFVAASVIEAGIASGLYVYVISSALGMLLLPNRAAPLLFILFFGFYPVIKSLIEKLKPAALQWILKLLALNVSLTVIWFLFRTIIFDLGDEPPALIILYAGANVVFAMFDYGFTKLIRFYMGRISKAS